MAVDPRRRRRQTVPADKLDKLEIHFRGNNEVEFVRPGPKPQRILGTYEVDPIKKEIRIRTKDVKGVVETMSYRWEGDRLTMTTKGFILDPMSKDAPTMRMQFNRAGKSESKELPLPKEELPELIPMPREVK